MGLIVALAVIAGLLVLCCLLALVGAIAFSRFRVRDGVIGWPRSRGGTAPSRPRELDRAFPVQGAVVLDVRNPVGDVTIEGTEDAQVVVESLVRALAPPSRKRSGTSTLST